MKVVYLPEIWRKLYSLNQRAGNINLYISSSKSSVMVTFDGGHHIQGILNNIGFIANISTKKLYDRMGISYQQSIVDG